MTEDGRENKIGPHGPQWLPSVEELTVPVEMKLSTPYMKAAALYMHKACETDCKEFMLCRSELEDPRKCLQEGRAVTACGVRFLQKVKKLCRPEFEEFAHCIDTTHKKQYIARCRVSQRLLDECMADKVGLERPRPGYYMKLHIHDTNRPEPPSRFRDYHAEAKKVVDELPPDYRIREDFKDYTFREYDWFNI